MSKWMGVAAMEEAVKQANKTIDERIKESQPTITDYLKANEKMLTKTKAKMVTIESLKQFAGISEQSEE